MGIGPITARQECKRQQVLGKMWDYLDDNFHKFSEANKLKVVCAFLPRTIPQKIEGEGFDTNITIVRTQDNKESISILRPMGERFNASVDS